MQPQPMNLHLSGGRHAGVLVPLFSIPSSLSWGVGEIGDVEPFARWLAGGSQCLLQLLPINEMSPGETSPYSALSAMAIDPQFISVHRMADFQASGGEAALDPDLRRVLDLVRASPRILYREVRALKRVALQRAFARFVDEEWLKDTARRRQLADFVQDQSWWLDDYATFRAVHQREGNRAWTEWDAPLRERQIEAIDAARSELARERLYHQYVQWIAHEQWQEVRRVSPVALLGDVPFGVATDSADVWASQDEFRLDASVGVPPDAFSDLGQDWKLPLFRWDVMRDRGDDWLERRARRTAALFDGYRIDHVVGYFRTHARSLETGEGSFTPLEEPDQVEQGERLMQLFLKAGGKVIAEDLGTVPDFVRSSLSKFGLPGYRILRWERYWSQPGQPFVDPGTYPAASVATTGTHDTEPMAAWWESLSLEDRHQLLAVPALGEWADGDPAAVNRPFDPQLRDSVLRALFGSGSDLLILPVQDVFGWSDRVNEPATVSEANWTFRLPWLVDRLDGIPEARERQRALREWSGRHDRS